ncbi:hypothetical protein ACHAW6_001087, partial [Cyclotella cf. meneghiniana]
IQKASPSGQCHVTTHFGRQSRQQIIAPKRGTRSKRYTIINSVSFTPGCANPSNLNTTTLLDTAANISLLTLNALVLQDATTLPMKSIMQLSRDILSMSGNATISLPKLPQSAKQAYRRSGLTNNLLSMAILADAGCDVFFFQQTGYEVSYNGDIILQRLWQVPIQSDRGNIVHCNVSIVLSTAPTPQANSIYECENTSQFINFYYATMGYPVISTWCIAIDKGYFQGCNGLTSGLVQRFVNQ